MMDQTHKDDADRRLGRALGCIISFAKKAADADRVSETLFVSVAGDAPDDEKRRD